jgi:hypothetical protein
MRRSTDSRSGASFHRPGAVSSARLSRRSLLQPAGPERLAEGVAGDRPRAHDPLVGFAQQAAVEAGEAFLLHLRPQPGLDLAVGPRPQIQGDDLGRPLAHALARDHEIGAALVLAAQEDIAVGVDQR